MKRVNLAAIANQLQDLAIQVPILCCHKRWKIVLIYLRLSLVIIYLFIDFFLSERRRRYCVAKWHPFRKLVSDGVQNGVTSMSSHSSSDQCTTLKKNQLVYNEISGRFAPSFSDLLPSDLFLSGKRPIETRRQETPAISHRRGPFQNPMVIFANNWQTERCIIGWDVLRKQKLE